MRDHSPGRDKQHILVGPWAHGGAISGGTTEIGFDHCLGPKQTAFEFPRAKMYIVGSNEWRDYDEYPPRQMEPRSLYT